MRIMIALLLAWTAGLIAELTAELTAELGGVRDVPTAWVVAAFLLAWFALGAFPALRRGLGRR